MKYLIVEEIKSGTLHPTLRVLLPDIKKLNIVFSDNSFSPPRHYCTCSGSVDEGLAGVVGVLTKEEFELQKQSLVERDLAEANRIAKHNRGVFYKTEADPLFFKYQRGEATKEEWLAKIQEIKDRFPDKK